MIRILVLLAIFTTACIAQAQQLSDNYRKPYQRQALAIYQDTVAMETSVGHHMVPTMAHYLADRFRDGGFDDEDIHVVLFQPPGGEETASLVVRYRGDGSAGKKPILFAGHMDVVGALRQDWVRDPFTLIEEDGYFFGRGTSDDKSGTTLLTTAFLRLKAEGFVPTRDLIIAFSGDEETAMATIRDLVASHRDLIDAEFAINADAGGGALDTDFTAKLIDVYPPSEDWPEGFDLNLTDGIVRARYRDSPERQTLMEPGEVYEITVEPFPTANLFQAGHRIRVDISSSNYPRFDLNPNTGEPLGRATRMIPADNTIYHDAARPSHVVLPIVPGRPGRR